MLDIATDNKKQTLDELINTKGFKMSFVAEQMGLSVVAFYKIRKNPKRMSADKIVKLSKIINVTPNEIFEVVKDN